MVMTQKSKKLLVKAMELSEAERAELARELIASLDGPADLGVEEAWAEEIRKRIDESRENPSEGSSWAEVRDRIEKKLWGAGSGS